MSYLTLWRNRAPSPQSFFGEGLPVGRRDLDRLFDWPWGADLGGAWGPVVDVRETDDSLVLEAELPGMRIDDVNVSIEDGVLTITGEKKREIEEGTEGSYHFTERKYGRFERSFRMPRNVDAETVKAEFTNGILAVTLPKAEEAKPRRIEVKAK